ncbi:MAG: helix-turn-helix domain-containing protein [Desulfobacterales bacterium]
MTDQVFRKGQLIFSEGDEATGLYVVISGRVKIFKLSVQKVENLSLEISKGQLSSVLGTVPETLSRILTKMIDSRLIRLKGIRGIQMLDHKGLQDLVRSETRLH